MLVIFICKFFERSSTRWKNGTIAPFYNFKFLRSQVFGILRIKKRRTKCIVSRENLFKIYVNFVNTVDDLSGSCRRGDYGDPWGFVRK